MPTITINGHSFDPVNERPALAAFNLDSVDTSTTDYVLIQVDGPVNKAKRAQLVDQGVELLAYEPENAYVARFPGSDLSGVRGLPFVRAAIPYPAFVKVRADLLDSGVNPTPTAVFSGAVTEVNRPGTVKRVDILLHAGIDPASVRDHVAQATGLDPAQIEIGGSSLRARLSSEHFDSLSKIDEIRQIEPTLKPTLFNDVAIGILEADVLQAQAPPLRGQGQVVAVCDTGFDRGSDQDVHPAFAGRVRRIYSLRDGRDPSDRHGHGTHVAGSILGDGYAKGYGPVAGAAPGADLVMQAAGTTLDALPTDLNDLFALPYENDAARVHSNSWGYEGSSGSYNEGSRQIDEFVRAHRDMAICFAAGNEGRDGNRNGVIDRGSVTAPGTAKNCITVGASENYRPEQSRIWATGSWSATYPVDPIRNDLWADDPMGMAAFSGRGPAQNNRTKPDLVAPGTSILSAHSRSAMTRNPGQALLLKSWGDSPDIDYLYMGGTSMACPLVAGCVALVRESLIAERGIATPSAALLKAALINGCVELQGQYAPSEAGLSPNFDSGFGRVNARRSIRTAEDGFLIFRDEREALDTDEEVSLDLDVSTPALELKITLVWTDEPGAALVNDLDLIVVGPDGSERHGNLPASSSGFDRSNNVEQVVWSNAATGSYQVKIRAFRTPLDSQNFALVMRLDRQA